MRSEDLIEVLAIRGDRVKRLPPISLQSAVWLGMTVVFLALVVLSVGLRPDFGQMIRRLEYQIELLAPLLTAIAACYAAFRAALPDCPRWVKLLPLAPLTLWLASIGVGCWLTWSRGGNGEAIWVVSWHCFRNISLTGVLTVAPMMLALRRALPFDPVTIGLLGGLASASLASISLSLYHGFDTSFVLLFWHLSAVALVISVAGIVSHLVNRLVPA